MKNKGHPMFAEKALAKLNHSVTSRFLSRIARKISAEADFPPEWDLGYRAGGGLATKLDWCVNDATLAARYIAEGSKYRNLMGKFEDKLRSDGIDLARPKDEDFCKGVVFIVNEARKLHRKVLSQAQRDNWQNARFATLGLMAGVLEEPNVHDLAGLVYDEAQKELASMPVEEAAPSRQVDENTPELKAWIAMLTKAVEDYYKAQNYEHVKPPKFEMMTGSRYIRVVRNDGVQRSAHSFIKRDSGDIMMAASWAAPAKHARGNIFAPDGGRSAIGPGGHVRYLR